MQYIEKQNLGGIVSVSNLISGLKYENCTKLKYLLCYVFLNTIPLVEWKVLNQIKNHHNWISSINCSFLLMS